MQNLLILYNPYYQKDVIEQHVKVLLDQDVTEDATVAFGKVRSKLRDYDHPFGDALQTIFKQVSSEAYLQLFLTDYASVYVAKVIRILEDESVANAPAYYREKSLNVENWFIISDIRRIVDNDFEHVRDRILGNMTTPHYGDHHYAIYGNAYVYPIVIQMDDPIDYFEHDDPTFRFFTEMFKSDQVLAMKQRLIDYRFGKEIFYALHPNSQDAIISAEIEYQENKHDPLYDFSAVVIKLAKSFEKEIYLFLRQLFIQLIAVEPQLAHISYQVQGNSFTLADYEYNKPNLGTNKYLLKQYEIADAVKQHFSSSALRYFILTTLPRTVSSIQPMRNETTHGDAATLQACEAFRKEMIGIGVNGVFCELIFNKKMLKL